MGSLGAAGQYLGTLYFLNFSESLKLLRELKNLLIQNQVLFYIAKELQQLWQSLFGKPQVQNPDIHIFSYQATLRMTKTEHRHHWDIYQFSGGLPTFSSSLRYGLSKRNNAGVFKPGCFCLLILINFFIILLFLKSKFEKNVEKLLE